MKYLYVYSNSSICYTLSINDNELDYSENIIEHSKLVSVKTMAKERGENNFVHIFEKYIQYKTEIIWKYVTTFCLN